MKLLIVESPGKLKTLRKILGSGWLLEASVGHTTELAHDGFKNLGFDIHESEVVTRYIPRGSRGQQVLAKLRKACKQADEVYLAMDPDREGEAIAWHLVEQLRLKKFSRVTYSQITESAVKAAIHAPRGLDFPLVHAQRARQCLDKLVGFEISPLLWNTTGGKSAGRVQSATLHLICERERERLAFKPKDYWTLHSHYADSLVAQYEPEKKSAPPRSAAPSAAEGVAPNASGSASVGALVGAARGTGVTAMIIDDEPARVDTQQEADRIAKIARELPHVVTAIEETEERRYPLPPLITSSLQQTAGVRLKLSPQKTMQIAQELYEGVGGNGLITYMRTDAVTLSPEFVTDTRQWLEKNEPAAMAERPPIFKTKADAQGAHEAIRPTSVDLTPEKARAMLNHDQLGVYRLIWERAVASQCRPARLAKTKVVIHAGSTKWIARALSIVEHGYLRFWNNIEEECGLPPLKLQQRLNFKDVKVEKKTTQPPSRYSEAKLVQLMEKLGIGRPSTYASTVMTLKDRDYAILDKGVLAPTELGMSTDDVLTKAMPDLVDVKFTAQMEESLDRIAEDKIGWQAFLCEWNRSYFRSAVSRALALIQTLPKMQPAPDGARFRKGRRGGGSAGGARLRQGSSRPSRAGQGARAARAGSETSDSGDAPSFARRKSAGGARPSRKNPRASAAGRTAPRAERASLDPAQSPLCEKGHGPLQARVSKKGDPYWKCGTGGCSSWLWPKS